MTFKTSLYLMILLGLSCTPTKPRFQDFYEEKEQLFLTCMKYAFHNFDSLTRLNCDAFTSTMQVFNQSHQIDREHSVINYALEIDSCLSSVYGGQPPKPLFDQTIYHRFSKTDTSFVYLNDTIVYQVEINKTLLAFNCQSKRVKIGLTLLIPATIDMYQQDFLDEQNRESMREQVSFFVNH